LSILDLAGVRIVPGLD